MSNVESNRSALQTLIEDYLGDDFPCHSYSGRSMYGKYCLAVRVRCSIGEFFSHVLEASHGFDGSFSELVETFAAMKTDSLGHDTVVYFPGTEYVDTTEEPCEDDDLND